MSKTRAFVVEDSPVILENLTAALEDMADVRVVGTAADERSAVAWLEARTDACDVVIIDMFLQAGSGLGVLKAMREYAPPPHRVVLTNYATDEMRVRCLALGAEVVFDKSRELEEMIDWLCTRAPRH